MPGVSELRTSAIVHSPSPPEAALVHDAAPFALMWAVGMFVIASAVAATYRESEQVIHRIFNPTFQMAAVLDLRAGRGHRFTHSDLQDALQRIATRELSEHRVVTHHALAEAADLVIEHLEHLYAIVLIPHSTISDVADPGTSSSTRCVARGRVVARDRGGRVGHEGAR